MRLHRLTLVIALEPVAVSAQTTPLGAVASRKSPTLSFDEFDKFLSLLRELVNVILGNSGTDNLHV